MMKDYSTPLNNYLKTIGIDNLEENIVKIISDDAKDMDKSKFVIDFINDCEIDRDVDNDSIFIEMIKHKVYRMDFEPIIKDSGFECGTIDGNFLLKMRTLDIIMFRDNLIDYYGWGFDDDKCIHELHDSLITIIQEYKKFNKDSKLEIGEFQPSTFKIGLRSAEAFRFKIVIYDKSEIEIDMKRSAFFMYPYINVEVFENLRNYTESIKCIKKEPEDCTGISVQPFIFRSFQTRS